MGSGGLFGFGGGGSWSLTAHKSACHTMSNKDKVQILLILEVLFIQVSEVKGDSFVLAVDLKIYTLDRRLKIA